MSNLVKSLSMVNKTAN